MFESRLPRILAVAGSLPLLLAAPVAAASAQDDAEAAQYVQQFSIGGYATHNSTAADSTFQAPRLAADQMFSLRYGYTKDLFVRFLLGTTNLGESSMTTSSGGSPMILRGSSAFSLGVVPEFNLINRGKTRLFLGTGLQMVRSTSPTTGTTGTPADGDATYTEFAFVPSLGVEYHITRELSFDASLGFPLRHVSQRVANKDQSQSQTISRLDLFNTNVMPIVGFHYHLGNFSIRRE